MVSAFKNEKHCREETIGAASMIAKLAVAERRKFTADELQRVEALLTTAETVLELGAIPREPKELIAYSQRSSGPCWGNHKRNGR